MGDWKGTVDPSRMTAAGGGLAAFAGAVLIWGVRQESSVIQGVGFALGCLAGLLWFLGRRFGDRKVRDALAHSARGEHLDAIKLLMRAEDAWHPNYMHDSRKTMAKDFKRLRDLIAAIREQAKRAGGDIQAEDLLAATDAFVEVYADRKNFTLWTSAMKPGPQARLEAATAKFPLLRGQFREECRTFLRQRGALPTD